MLLTKQFLSNLKEEHATRYIGTIKFDDLTSAIPMFESLDAYSNAQKNELNKSVDDFESGVRLYEKADFDKAKQYFANCVKNNNNDNLARFYLNKTINQMSSKLTYKL